MVKKLFALFAFSVGRAAQSKKLKPSKKPKCSKRWQINRYKANDLAIVQQVFVVMLSWLLLNKYNKVKGFIPNPWSLF
ncbi:TPA: hypothetical protein NHJ50_000030 [Legionella pneumophila]|nr:hypothetical protein [Legionella pneumophila]